MGDRTTASRADWKLQRASPLRSLRTGALLRMAFAVLLVTAAFVLAFRKDGFDITALSGLLMLVIVLLLAEIFLISTPQSRVARRSMTIAEAERQRYQAMLESLGVVFWEIDPRSRELLYISPESRTLLGFEPSELVRSPVWSQRFSEPDRRLLDAKIDRAMTGGANVEFEHQVNNRDGTRRFVRTVLSPVLDRSGGIERIRGVMVDDTETRMTKWKLELSERRFWLMADQAPAFIWVAEPDKSISFFNKCWLEHTGRTIEQERGHGWHASIHPDDLGRLRAAFESAMDRRESYECSYRLRRASDGGYSWLQEHGAPLYDEGGRFAGFIGSAVDISEMKEAQRHLEESRQRMERHLERTPLAALEADREGRVVAWNRAAAEIFGYSAEQAMGRDAISLIVPPEVRPEVEIAVRQLLDRGEPNSLKNENIRSDGRRIMCAWYNTPLPDSGGRIVGYAALADDITERVRNEKLLADSESLYRLLAEHAADMIARQRATGEFIYVSPASRLLFGMEPADLVGVSPFSLVHPDDQPYARAYHQALLDGSARGSVRLRMRHRDGQYITVESAPRVLRGDSGEPAEIVAVMRDITPQVIAERQVQQSRQELQTIADALPVVIGRLDERMKLRFVNAAGRQLYGIEPDRLIGTPLESVVPPERMAIHRPHIERALRGAQVRYEFVLASHDRGNRTMDVTLIPDRHSGPTTGVFFLIADVTDPREARRAIESAAVLRGRLLSELNHRLKNALGSLLTLIELCRVRQPTVDGFANAMRRRVQAMNDVHSLLSERSYAPLEIETIVRTMIPPEAPGKMRIGGPKILVPPRQATPLGFVIQELMSNSLKYGALAVPGGTLTIQWSFEPAHDPDGFPAVILIDWEERGITLDHARVQPGMGTQLITGFASHELRGQVEFRYEPNGVKHRIVVRPATDDELSLPDHIDGLGG